MDIYAWLKAFHIIAVIAWMAGMLYLPRLFVYHCAADKGPPDGWGLSFWPSHPQNVDQSAINLRRWKV